jgi:hypothetical protein
MASQVRRIAPAASLKMGAWVSARKACVWRTAHEARALVALVIAAVALVTAFVAASSAVAAEAPRWDIVATSNPTNLKPSSPANEVQNVTVNATGGTFNLTAVSQDCNAAETTTPIPFNATAAQVQSALEALGCVGTGNASVSGGPGGSSSYSVTFVGELSDTQIPVMSADGSSLIGGSAMVTEVTEGVPAPILIVTATNVGGASTDGSTITLADSLPAGLTATGISGVDTYASGGAFAGHGGTEMSCTALSCTYSGKVDPGDTLVMTVTLEVAESLASSVLNQATVSGGGPAGASASTPLTVGDLPAGFGPVPGSVLAAVSSEQAGTHPNVTVAYTMDTSESNTVAADTRDIRVDTPPGLVGSAVGMPQCTMHDVLSQSGNPDACPNDTMVGMATLVLGSGQRGPRGGPVALVTPVYNIAPAPGEPVAFAFDALIPVRLDTSVLSDGNYGVRVTASGLSEIAQILGTSITIWGVPADHSGPGMNGDKTVFGQQFGGPNTGQTRVPLLSNPQQCSGPLSAEMSTDSWTKPGVFVSSGPVSMGTLTGCGLLSLGSSLSVLPDTLEAGEPAGYSVGLGVPQSSGPEALATPNVRDVKVTLPLGTVINPSAAQGLAACSSAEFYGSERGLQEPAQPGHCPREAQVGTVEVKTPALPEPLTGEVYLAEPECDPCTPEDAEDGRMARLFLQLVGEGESGIVVKTEGRAEIDQATGRIVTLFEEQPPLPFSELKLTLGGGPRAVLANPRACGPVTSVADTVEHPLYGRLAVVFGVRNQPGLHRPAVQPDLPGGDDECAGWGIHAVHDGVRPY